MITTYVIAGLIFLAIMLLATDETGEESRKTTTNNGKKVNEIDESFRKALYCPW